MLKGRVWSKILHSISSKILDVILFFFPVFVLMIEQRFKISRGNRFSKISASLPPPSLPPPASPHFTLHSAAMYFRWPPVMCQIVCVQTLLICVILCRETPHKADSTHGNEGLGIKTAVKGQLHCGHTAVYPGQNVRDIWLLPDVLTLVFIWTDSGVWAVYTQYKPTPLAFFIFSSLF